MRKKDLKAHYGDNLSYELPAKRTPKTVGKVIKMTKSTSEPKSSKKYAKTRGEHYKDIVIAILVTAVVAFVAGSVYANSQHDAIAQAVQRATAQAETVKK